MVVVKSTTEDEELLSFLYKDLEGLKASYNLFVELILEDGLQLKRNAGNLQDCVCFIPSLRKKAKSINHAATLVSEAFEIRRKSHTKDVFRDAYFRDDDGVWKPLNKWREKVNPLFSASKNIRELTTKLNKKADVPSDFNKILDLINVSKEIAQAIVNLQGETDGDQEVIVQKILNTLVGVDNLKKILKVWKENQSNSNESFWQKLLEKNALVLSQVFSTPVITLPEAYVGGKGIENTGGSIVDFLVVNKLTKSASLIEIKTPTSRLLGSKYRNGAYAPSSDLVGAVTQISTSKDSLVKEYTGLVNNSKSYFEIFNPLCIVVSGHAGNELLDDEKRRSFELYRSNHRNVRIVTYDEVFEKIKTLVEILEGKD